ncbi:photosystem II reaction center W protein, chloroplastic-like [Actinidia eriantha]|uniref:photosystem II reaction center W protein, chloroplastic-like n=1 Tax=Actinidia eriantha TaxID=165200 RepID=UPI00258CB494|nr:photosystem II reaction center W protein, chloroplastic-like [Actinidia eriantha]
MATITACTPTLSITRIALMRGRVVVTPSSLLGIRGKFGVPWRAKSVEESESKAVTGASLVAAACAVATKSSPAVALVDEGMSTEGTGLPFGLSNNLLGWILFGVFSLSTLCTPPHLKRIMTQDCLSKPKSGSLSKAIVNEYCLSSARSCIFLTAS